MSNDEVEILLVEDSRSDAKLATIALSQHNLANRVHHVIDGQEALDFLFRRGKYEERKGRRQPSVILLDLKLPKVHGLEVLRQLKSNDELRKVPVVILTSSKEDRDLEACYAMGVNSYIVKPMDFDNFLKAVADAGLYWLLVNRPPPGSLRRETH